VIHATKISNTTTEHEGQQLNTRYHAIIEH